MPEQFERRANMPDSVVIERLALAALGVLLLSNFIIGFSKYQDVAIFPVVTMLIACAVVTATLFLLAQQANVSWATAYYWRYSYLGPIPLLMPAAYILSLTVSHGDGWAVWILVGGVGLLIFWLLGWVLNPFLVLLGIAMGISVWVDSRQGN